MTPADKAVPRMDEETERLILDVDEAISSFYAIESDYEIDLAQVRVDAAFNALRLRIAQLISEARAEGRTQPCAVCTSTSEWPL